MLIKNYSWATIVALLDLIVKEMILITLSLQLDGVNQELSNTWSLRIHGVLIGVKMDTSDFKLMEEKVLVVLLRNQFNH
jgi:hypothetical protein